ncbi:uncharacterized protein LOC113334566 [Papaver somniferum]|uniref:uncharacterized protein LOC113334566 n=1 Tax=Papaver somniferum TaxID=3469 RepID=UPI000E7030CF|nr:uncharacterized protein LOC113334566 [Papaver somniferum]
MEETQIQLETGSSSGLKEKSFETNFRTTSKIILDLLECGTHGNSPSLFIPDDIIDDSLEERKFSLIGRLDLVKIKVKIAESTLRIQWKLKGSVQLIPLGKGFFIIKLENEEDKLHIWSGNWVVEEKNLTLKNWEPNFNPAAQETTSAFVWVNFPGLSIEYWKKNIILHMGISLGRPIKVDEITLKKEAGYYTSVFVEIDLTKAIPSKIWVESKYGGFEQEVPIPKIPKFCNYCQVIGHYVAEYINKRKDQGHPEVAPTTSIVKQVWRKVTPKKKRTSAQTGFDIYFSSPSKIKTMENIDKNLLESDEEVDAIIPPTHSTEGT